MGLIFAVTFTFLWCSSVMSGRDELVLSMSGLSAGEPIVGHLSKMSAIIKNKES